MWFGRKDAKLTHYVNILQVLWFGRKDAKLTL
jgi:hypothetical protein